MYVVSSWNILAFLQKHMLLVREIKSTRRET